MGHSIEHARLAHDAGERTPVDSSVRDEHALPPLQTEVATEGDQVSLLPRVGAELAAPHRHRRRCGDDRLLSTEVLLTTVQGSLQSALHTVQEEQHEYVG